MRDGRTLPLEPKPMEILHLLLTRANDAVSKSEILDTVWPDVHVVEGSLPTAIAKLRRLLDEDARDPPLIVTVPRVGYRIGVPVLVENAALATQPASRTTGILPQPRRLVAAIAGLAAVVALGAATYTSFNGAGARAPMADQAELHRAGVAAMRRLDLVEVDRLVSAGWHPSLPTDRQDNDALKMLLARCEWDPGHDKEQLMLIAKTLIDSGARIEHRNIWGDTAYSIAAAPRYCGPDHPVTVMLRNLCKSGEQRVASYCEADYSRRRPPLPINEVPLLRPAAATS